MHNNTLLTNYIILIISTIIISFSGCNDEDIIDPKNINFLEGPWEINKQNNIILYSRPQNYSTSPSPDSNSIKIILKNQNDFIDELNNKLYVKFNKAVKIYLFNYDESMEKLGSNGGGRTDCTKREMYCTFFNIQFLDQVRNVKDYLGVHEMAHVVSINELGLPMVRLMSEGYAVALDGGYSTYQTSSGEYIRPLLFDIMKYYNSNGKILIPSQLLQDNNISESLFYPQAGYFINWLFEKYGIQRINLLFKVSKENYVSEFEKITGEKFSSIENEYIEHCKSLK